MEFRTYEGAPWARAGTYVAVRPRACGPLPPLTGCYHPHGEEREHNYRAYYGVYHRMIQLVRFGILYERIAELKSLSLSIQVDKVIGRG